MNLETVVAAFFCDKKGFSFSEEKKKLKNY